MNKTCLLITTFNRGHLLKHNLERLTRLTLPDEVLVISDGCSDNTEEVCKSFEGRLPIRCIYNHNPDWSICSMARNIGIKNTDCDIIITAEPELFFITDLIKQMLELHKQNPEHVINAGTVYHMGREGSIESSMYDNPVLKNVNESDSKTFPTNPKGYAKIQGWVAPFSALYVRDWLFEINGWDESFVKWGHDDTDLLTRLRIKGKHNMIIPREIEVIHQWHPTLPPAAQQAAVQHNDKIMMEKKLSVDGYEDPNNPQLIANIGKEWGIIKTR